MTPPEEAPDSRPQVLTDVEGGETFTKTEDYKAMSEAYRILAQRFADLASQCLAERIVTNNEIRELKALVIKHGIAPAH